jgi:MscS family membrane protein
MNHRLFPVRQITSFLLFAGLGLSVGLVHAQPKTPRPPTTATPPTLRPKPKEVPLIDRLRSPLEPDRSLQDKLRSPRQTLQTLYFAILTYDLFPAMIEDAIACLDLDSLRPRPSPSDAALAALDLEEVLQGLSLPLSSVPDEGVGEGFVLHDTGAFKVALRLCLDGCWRFDAETLTRLPAMRIAARQLPRPRTADLVALREGLTDPRAAMRQFLSDSVRGDFYAAARALDLSGLSQEERRRQGPVLAQQLAFVLQRRGYVFRQEVPYQPDGPPYTWHANSTGRIALERVHHADGKDAWMFTKRTVRNAPAMYAAVQSLPADARYARLGVVVPAVQQKSGPAVQKRPEDVPAHLGSPRAVLQGFFRTMDAAETNDAQLADALEYLDLEGLPAAERATLGVKLAPKLEAVLRKLPIDLSTISDDWSAGPLVLGEAQGVHVEIVRQHDGSWSFSEATIAHVPEMYDRLAGKARSEKGRGSNLDSARDTMITFQAAIRRRDFATAARCLNLDEVRSSARPELGPVLAFKLQYVLGRIGRIYVEEVPDNPEAMRYILYRGELGRIVLDRRADGPEKGQWQFTPETVSLVEPMFRAVLGRPLDESLDGEIEPRFWDTSAVWLRLQMPKWLSAELGPLDLYQWLGLILAALGSWISARIVMACVTRLVAWLLQRGGSQVSQRFVITSLRPLTWLAAVWSFFVLLQWLDLPLSVADPMFSAEKFILAATFGWLGVRLMDLSLAIYANTELLQPHRSFSDMIVPVSVRLGKAIVLLVVATYAVYQVGEFDLLGRFLTGLGVAGLAASLAAQDALKNYFGTLLLIGERAFKIGDRITVGSNVGVVEQVGFRSTRLRTESGALLTVPNAVIAGAAIENRGAAPQQRFNVTILLSTGTSLERFLQFRERLRAWLGRQPQVARDEVGIQVQQLLDGGVELSVAFLLAVGAPAEGRDFRASFYGEVLALAEALGVELAPSCREALRLAESASAPEAGLAASAA